MRKLTATDSEQADLFPSSETDSPVAVPQHQLKLILDLASESLPDEDDAPTLLPRAAVNVLLELASRSKDLDKRSMVFVDDGPFSETFGGTFRSQIVDDLVRRDDLDYEFSLRLIKRLWEDPEDWLPDEAGEALVRAWVRSEHAPLVTQGWCEWFSWKNVAPDDARKMLGTAVAYLTEPYVDAHGRRTLPFWIKRVAPVAFPDPVERLEWLNDVLQTWSSGDMGELPSLDFVASELFNWFSQIPETNPNAVIRGLEVIEGLAGSAFEDGSFEEISSHIPGLYDSIPWSAMPRPVLGEVLESLVCRSLVALQAGRSEGVFRRWLCQVAPVVYPDVADRLLWFAKSIGRPTGDAPQFAEHVSVDLTECVCSWLKELQTAPPEDIAVVLRTFRRTPMAACLWKADIDDAMNELREAIRTGI